MSRPEVSVVVVSFEARDDLLRCLESLRTVTLSLETIVVDNASGDGSAAAARQAFPAASLIANSENRGFAAACNQGAAAAAAEFLLFLNNDAAVRPGSVETLLDRLRSRPEAAAAGPRTLNPDGTVQVSFGPDLGLLSEWRQRRLVSGVRHRKPEALRQAQALAAVAREPDWLSGSCLLVRTEAFRAVGGFDEGFFLYEEDADLCRRLRRAGWTVLFVPEAEALHHLGRSMAHDSRRAGLEYHRSHLRYYRKHNGLPSTLVLRAWLAVRAALGWAAGNRGWGRVLRLALTGR